MLDASLRLRRAICINDASLVERIIKAYPNLLLNPDLDNKSQTSLHLAAELGHAHITSLLLQAGHDSQETSRDTDWNTPLILAARGGHQDVGTLIVDHCPRSIYCTNKLGLDALSICCRHEDMSNLMTCLLSHPTSPASVWARDRNGDTPLHHASAFGSLKALRILLEYGAFPLATNALDWTPLAYSRTVAVNVYFQKLIAEYERQPAKSETGMNTMKWSPQEQKTARSKSVGVRLVTRDTSSDVYLPDRRALTPAGLTTPTTMSFEGMRARAISGN